MAELIEKVFRDATKPKAGPTQDSGKELTDILKQPRFRKQFDGFRKTDLFKKFLDRIIDFNIDEHGCITGKLLWPTKDEKKLLLDAYVGNAAKSFIIDAKSGNTVVFDAAFRPGTSGKAELLAQRQDWVVDAIDVVPGSSAEMKAAQDHLLSRKAEFEYKAKVAASCGKEYVVLLGSPALAEWAWKNLNLSKDGPQVTLKKAPLGGAYGMLKNEIISDHKIEIHHFPGDNLVKPFFRSQGVAIAMYKWDHGDTQSFRNQAIEYRQRYRPLIEQSPDGVREVFRDDKEDILSIDPVYARAVRQAEAYFEGQDYLRGSTKP